MIIRLSQEKSGFEMRRGPTINPRNPYPGPIATTRRGGLVKGVGKFGEVMAGPKGEADYVASFETLFRFVHSGSQPKAIRDLLVRGLRLCRSHHTGVAGCVLGSRPRARR